MRTAPPPLAVVVVAALLVAAAAFAAHGSSLSGGFVYDDHRFVEHNRAVESLADPGRFFRDASTASAAQGVEPDVYRPLRTLAFAVDRAAFGLDPFGFRFASVLLHAVNALLAWSLALAWLAREAASPTVRLVAATFAGLAFAAHPVTSESVAWVSSRGDLLAWTFVLLALHAYRRPGTARTAFGAALVALACLAKESAVVAFALVPFSALAARGAGGPSRRETLARAGLLLAVSAAYVALRVSVLPPAKDLPVLAQIDFPEGGRAGAARGMLAGLVSYARSLLWPVGFPFDRNVHTDPVPDSWGDPEVVAGGAILFAVLALGLRALRRGDGVVALAALGSLATLLPVSNVLVPLKAFTAERFLYPLLPFAAAGLAAGGLRVAARRTPAFARASAAAALAVVVAWTALASARGRAWRDESSLWTAVRDENPMNPRAWEGLGFVAMREGRVGAAEAAFRTYREFQPGDGKVEAELAEVFYDVFRSIADASEDLRAESNVVARQRFVLEQTILQCRRAIDAWTRRGLTRGRGDERTLRRTLALWREAAFRYGDLLETRTANQMLAGDDVRASGRQGYDQRRMVLVLAAMSLTREGEPEAETDGKGAEPAREAERASRRATLLGDARVDPNLSDPDAMEALLPAFEALLAERDDDDELRRKRVTLLVNVADVRARDAARPLYVLALSDLERLARARRGDRWVADALDYVRRRLAS